MLRYLREDQLHPEYRLNHIVVILYVLGMQFAFEQEGTVGTRGYFSLDKAEMLLEITMSKFGKRY